MDSLSKKTTRLALAILIGLGASQQAQGMNNRWKRLGNCFGFTDAESRVQEANKKLLDAAKEGSLKDVREALLQGAELETTDKEGWTPLYWACASNHLAVATYLMVQGAQIGAKGESTNTPLHIACHRGHLKIIALLLDRGAQIEARNETGSTPLHKACYDNHPETVALLLERGAQTEIKDGENKTPLQDACFDVNLEIAKCLIAHGAVVGQDDRSSHPQIENLLIATRHFETLKNNQPVTQQAHQDILESISHDPALAIPLLLRPGLTDRVLSALAQYDQQNATHLQQHVLNALVASTTEMSGQQNVLNVLFTPTRQQPLLYNKQRMADMVINTLPRYFTRSELDIVLNKASGEFKNALRKMQLNRFDGHSKSFPESTTPGILHQLKKQNLIDVTIDYQK